MKRLLIIAALVGVVLALAKKRSVEQAAWQGLSETEARSRLDERLPSRIPDDTRAVISDRIVGRMREKGVIVADEDIDLTENIDLTASAAENLDTADDDVSAGT